MMMEYHNELDHADPETGIPFSTMMTAAVGSLEQSSTTASDHSTPAPCKSTA
jgi:hypothetical protein